MICKNCLQRLSRQSAISSSPSQLSRRTFTSTSTRSSTPVSFNAVLANSRPNDHPAATSTSAAQPFTAGTASQPVVKEKIQRPPSSVPAGTPLRGINYMKAEVDPIAMEDHEYPDWLWTLLDKETASDAIEGEFSKSKKQRRRAAKLLRERGEQVAEIPLQHQTIDLFAGDSTLEGAKRAADERRDLTRAMRADRRAKIKEANFLKAMS